MRQLVPDQLTPISFDEAIDAFAKAHIRCMGLPPSAWTLACLVAQSALETGNFQKIHNYAFGNAKAPADYDGLVANFQCDEIFNVATANQAKRLGSCTVHPWKDGLYRVVLLNGHPWADFQAFPDAPSGAFEQVRLLALSDRYRHAWHSACAGDAHGFAMELGAAGYFTADRTVYANAVASIARRILPACASYLAGEGSAVTAEDQAYIAALVYRTLDESRGTDPSELKPEDVEGVTS